MHYSRYYCYYYYYFLKIDTWILLKRKRGKCTELECDKLETIHKIPFLTVDNSACTTVRIATTLYINR